MPCLRIGRRQGCDIWEDIPPGVRDQRGRAQQKSVLIRRYPDLTPKLPQQPA